MDQLLPGRSTILNHHNANKMHGCVHCASDPNAHNMWCQTKMNSKRTTVRSFSRGENRHYLSDLPCGIVMQPVCVRAVTASMFKTCTHTERTEEG